MANRENGIDLDLIERSAYRRSYIRALFQALDETEARAKRAERAIDSIKTIGARSGTDINAWNKAFDVIDEFLYDNKENN